MLSNLFTVFDSKANAYLPPFNSPTAGTAIRMFAQAANDQSHDFNKHAGDYTLFHIASYDDATATIEPLKAHINLGLAINLIEAAPTRETTPLREAI